LAWSFLRPPIRREICRPRSHLGHLNRLTKTTESGAAVYPPGSAGITSATCDYMANPPYTDAAREAQLEGVIVVEAIVTPDGKVESAQVVKGVPGGLNDVTRKTIETWRCKPAAKDNQPFATIVQFEVNFRLFKNP
jgi:TonB family protein